jgi:hypothetical protein
MARFSGAWLLMTLGACNGPRTTAITTQDASPTPPAGSTVVTSPTENLADRYRGKPMLVIIENYALSVIGALPPDKEASIKQAVKQAFGGDDDWRATVRQTMAWPKNVDAEILSNWQSFRQSADSQGIPAYPAAFARAFGDAFSK